MGVVKNIKLQAWYSSKYLSKADFERHHFSSDWVFPYWWEFGRFYKKENGLYVRDNELVRLALITFEERRDTNLDFDLFMDVRKYGWENLLKMNDEKWRDILMGNKKGEELRKGRRCDSEGCEQLELWGGEVVKVL